MTLICFDLDGTLVDPLDAIATSLGHACGDLDIACPERGAIARQMGLDFGALFVALPEPRFHRLMEHFHELFCEEGVFAQQVHDGVHLMLARLKRQGQRLHAISSQSASCARRALHHLDLNLIFEDVTGPRPGEPWQSKRELLARMKQEGILGAGGVLVGDRADDILAARFHGLKGIGVTYGFGSRTELAEAQADVILDSVEALDAWLEKELKGPEIHDPFDRSE